MKNYDFPRVDFLSSYNGLLKFQPREANVSCKNPAKQKLMSLTYLRKMPEKYQNILAGLRLKFKSKSIIDTKNTWNHILKYAYENDYPNYELDIFESAFFDWDNTARYLKRATIYTEQLGEEKCKFMKDLYDKCVDNRSEFIFFNAWNEWSESAYLEPNKKNGSLHLDIIKQIFTKD